MVGKYKVITLCGSTRFKDEFIAVQKKLSLEGNIVVSVGLFGHSGDEEVSRPGVKEMLDDMHLVGAALGALHLVVPGSNTGDPAIRQGVAAGSIDGHKGCGNGCNAVMIVMMMVMVVVATGNMIVVDVHNRFLLAGFSIL